MRRAFSSAAAATLLAASIQVGLALVGPAAGAAEVGTNDFRISQEAVAGGVGFSSVAYSPGSDRYLVVWSAVAAENPPDAKFEVHGQFVDGRTGAEIGSDFLVARHGAAGDVQTDTVNPEVVYNASREEYLVVYVGGDDFDADPNSQLDVREVYAQRISAAGAQVGGELRVSDLGSDDANTNYDVTEPPDVVWNATDDEYLVVFGGDSDENGMVNGEQEIFEQRLGWSSGNLVQVGANDVQISDVGGANGLGAFDANDPAVAWSSTDDTYLATWQADDTGTDNAFRIYGQVLSSAGAETGTNDFLVGGAGAPSDTTTEAFVPDAGWNATSATWLVVWEGDGANATSGTVNDFEIWGQTLNPDGTPSGGMTQLTQVGTPGTASHAQSPALAWNSVSNEWLLTWVGDFSGDDQEIFGKRLGPTFGVVEDTFRISDMGPDGEANAPLAPAVAYSERAVNGYLVTWSGENHGVLPAGESEVWGQMIAPTSDLQLTKSASQPFPAAGDPVTYTLTYTNAGPEKVYDVVLTDLVPAQLTGVSYTSTGATLALRAGTTYIWDIASLSSGQGGTITVTGTVASGATEGTVVGNTASITTTTIAKDPNPANNSQTANFTVDNPPFLVSITANGTTPTNTASVSWTVTFDQSVDDVNAASFALTTTGLTGASITSVTGSGATRTVTADAGSGDGSIRLDMVDGTGITDTGIAGSKGLLTGNLPYSGPAYVVDRTPPTATLTINAADPTHTSPIPVSVDFSESVTGLSLADLSVTNGSVANLAGSGSSYTVDLVPAGQGTVTVGLPADAVTDSAGNGNMAATSKSVAFDSTRPTLALTSGTGDPTNDSPIAVTAQFSEPVAGFTAADISTGNATVGNFQAVDGDTYTFDLTPAGQGTVTADAAAGAATDAAGNDSFAASFSRLYDSEAPTIELTTTATSPTNTAPFAVTATVSEDVAAFDTTKVQVTGGTAGNFGVLDAHTYTFDVTPSGDGTVTIHVTADAVSDAAGNGSPATNALTIVYDATAPTVAINQASGQADPTSGSSVSFAVAFDEPVTGFTAADVDLTASTAGPVTATVSGSGASYTVTVTDMNAAGTVVAMIPSGAAKDGAGNLSTASTSTDNTVTYQPNGVPSIGVAPGDACTSSPNTAVIALITGDPDGDTLTVTRSTSNAAVLPLSAIVVSADHKRLRITPPARSTQGSAVVTVSVSDGQATATVKVTVRVGTYRAETLTGTSGPDVILGRGGDDTIRALGGVDVVCAGDGNDLVDGGDGRDMVGGGLGRDDVRGGLGNDVLRGGAGRDVLRGGAGADRLLGGTGADRFSGGPGVDVFPDFDAAEGDTTDGT